MLKRKLIEGGYSVTQVAAELGKSQANFSAKLSNDSVKTELLEQLCEVLNKDLFFFYGGTEYLPVSSVSADGQVVPKSLYDELKENSVSKSLYNDERERLQQEIYQYRDTIRDLQNQIAEMQRGKSIPDIAKREVG